MKRALLMCWLVACAPAPRPAGQPVTTTAPDSGADASTRAAAPEAAPVATVPVPEPTAAAPEPIEPPPRNGAEPDQGDEVVSADGIRDSRKENGVFVFILDHPDHFRCFDLATGKGQICAPTVKECRAWAKATKSKASCMKRSAAACNRFNRDVDPTETIEICFGTLATCRQVERVLESGGLQPGGDCFVMRYEP